jgi:hypothetical protein
MAQTCSILLGAVDRERLAAVVADRNRPHKHVQRARIILHSAERQPVLEVARRAGVLVLSIDEKSQTPSPRRRGSRRSAEPDPAHS